MENLTVGRLSTGGGGLVIRTGMDTRRFCITLEDVAAVMEGEPRAVPLFPTGESMWMARLVGSGKAENIRVDPILSTVSTAQVKDVVAGRGRKAAVFRGEMK